MGAGIIRPAVLRTGLENWHPLKTRPERAVGVQGHLRRRPRPARPAPRRQPVRARVRLDAWAMSGRW